MDFIGNALRCYKGHFFNNEPMEPKLVDCKRNEDVCLSGYAKTNLYSEDGFEVPAGSWAKMCYELIEVSELFGYGASDRCIRLEESKLIYNNPRLLYKVRYLHM